MSESLIDDVKKAVQSKSPVKKEEPLILKEPRILQHSLDSVLESPQKLNENAGIATEKKGD